MTLRWLRGRMERGAEPFDADLVDESPRSPGEINHGASQVQLVANLLRQGCVDPLNRRRKIERLDDGEGCRRGNGSDKRERGENCEYVNQRCFCLHCTFSLWIDRFA